MRLRSARPPSAGTRSLSSTEQHMYYAYFLLLKVFTNTADKTFDLMKDLMKRNSVWNNLILMQNVLQNNYKI